MKNKFMISVMFLFFVLSFLIISNQVLASATQGTIDPAYHYAWGENVGFIDFSQVEVTDTALSGSVYSPNIGWIDLSTITNDGGTLSGYAWGENVGWIDFSKVTIGSDGVFAGDAYSPNIGWITFGTGNNKVLTDWRPASARTTTPPPPVTQSGGGHMPLALLQASSQTPSPIITTTVPPPSTVCKEGENFNTTNGLPCASFTTPPAGTPPPKGGEGSTPTCTLTLTLKQGYRGTQVKCLQTKLNLSPDGIFGPKTKQLVMTFQKANNLKADGIVGPVTRKMMN